MLLAVGCHRGGPQPIPAYTVRDSTAWECGGTGGVFGVLYRGRAYVDSIDLGTGFQVLPTGVAFTPVRADTGDSAGGAICPAAPVLLRHGERRPLEGILPYFKPFFPARAVSGTSLFYWAFRGGRVYAARYDVSTGQADTVFLLADPSLLQTDNPYQFLAPIIHDSTVTYRTWDGRRFVVNRRMRPPAAR